MTEVFEVCESNFYTNLREAQKLIKNPCPTQISTPIFDLVVQQASESLK